jgi:hypothetical protein
MNRILSSLPDHAFTGLDNKAMLTLTTSACRECTVEEGGTVEAIAMELRRIAPDHIPIRDLDTGVISRWALSSELEIGERIFWHCLHKILSSPLEESRAVDLLTVKEPSKTRCVTKGPAYVKVVLDVVSKLCSWALKKGVPSSQSGMSKESHGWEFFKSLFDSGEPDLFELEYQNKEVIDSSTYIVEEVYRDVFVSSTDYETATDYMSHEVANVIGDMWMRKCGIPPILRGIVVAICFKPRTVYFSAKGPISELGEYFNGNIRSIRTVRGVLMGDPLTKLCLHMVNIVCRTIAEGKSQR